MAVIKYIPEDFIVREVQEQEFLTDGTYYHVYEMKKRNYTTERAVSQLARSLGKPRKFFGYAGTKDKPALTYQYVTIKGVSRERVESLELKDIELSFIGYSKVALQLGSLKGNHFTITIRDLPKDITFDVKEKMTVPNYFDQQRFSYANVKIGIAMLKGDFEGAVNIVIETDKDHSENLQNYLKDHLNDYVGALRRIPRKILLFYVHSVQSVIFNDELCAFMEKNAKNIYKQNYSQGELVFGDYSGTDLDEVDLLGYLNRDASPIQKEILLKHEIEVDSFRMRSFPEFSLEGASRKSFFTVEHLKVVEISDDDMFDGRKKAIISFDLGKGSYATMVLRMVLAKYNQEFETRVRRREEDVL